MTLKVVHIAWIDSEAINEWHRLDEVDHDLKEIHSVGFLVHEDESKYLLALSYALDVESINAAMWIPKGCVTRVKKLCTIKMS